MPPCHGWCHAGEPQPIGIAGRDGLQPRDVRVPIQESFPHLPAESQILHLYLGSFKAASLLWAVPGKMGNMLRLVSPFILGEQRSSSSVGLWFFHFPAFLITEGLRNGELRASQRELTWDVSSDRLLITGVVSSISALINAE